MDGFERIYSGIVHNDNDTESQSGWFQRAKLSLYEIFK